MNISPVSSSNIYTMKAPVKDREIEFLQKHKMQLQEQIEKIKQSDMDPKMKEEKIKGLNDQMLEIDTRIKQKQMEEMKPEQNKEDVKKKKDSENKEDQGKESNGALNTKHMISAASGYSELKTMGRVRTQLIGELRIATSSGENPEAGRGIEAKIEKLENDMHKKIEKIEDDLSEFSKDVEKSGSRKNDSLDKDRENNVDNSQNISSKDEVVIDKEQIEHNGEKSPQNSETDEDKHTKHEAKAVSGRQTTIDIRV